MKQPFVIACLCFLFACAERSQNKRVDEQPVQNEAVVPSTSPDTAIKQLVKPVSPAKSQHDTVFIHRELTKDYYHAIYIEKDRNATGYKWLTDFTIDADDLSHMDRALKSIPVQVKKFNTQGLPKEWVSLYLYKNKYYLYAPSDWGNTNKRIISDSLLIFWYLDGPFPFVLNSIKKINRNTYKITSTDYLNNQDVIVKPEVLNIYLVDEKNKIAVWQYKDEGENWRYRLFVAKEQALNFDLIVNYCDRQKQLEFDFDEIDYKKLLNRDPKKALQ